MHKKLFRPPVASSIKFKLTVATLLPLFIGIAICWLIGVFILTTRIAGQAQDKVRNDLNAAREILNGETAQIRDIVRFTAAAPYSVKAVAAKDTEELAALISPLLKSEHLDILTVVDPVGTVLFRASNPQTAGDNRSQDPYVARALKGEIVAGPHILRHNDLILEGNELAARATTPIRNTPRARQRSDVLEQSGMLLMVAAPVRDVMGNIVGALYGGKLLNNQNTIVDKIKDTIYEEMHEDGHELGAATIFLDDLRIATNVPASDGRRAIGTRMSEEVYNRVMLKREKWADRAFVVNNWFFSAYEPILSISGVPIGALYVGMQERPYTFLKVKMGLIYSGVLLLGTLIGLAVSGSVSSRLAKPIRELERLARRFAAGERGQHLQVTSNDEIGSLTAEFNRMTDSLTRQEEEIRGLNRNLELKVRERTVELEEKNMLLVKAQDELIRTAKLADLGVLAAGVAHEINNPMAIIRGNAELLQMALPPDHADREEVDTIAQQVGRVERIVSNLLRFAHQEHKKLGQIGLHAILNEIVKQIGHQVPLTGISMDRHYADDLPTVEGDQEQLRQVFTNLILNAIQAMEGGGKLTLSTGFHSEIQVIDVTVSDTGNGIPPEDRDKIFSPFFTTKPRGTGLGLSVSYGIVQDHGGKIEVESASGRGTTFRVLLPVTQRESVPV